MLTKSLLLTLTCVLLTALVTNCEEEEKEMKGVANKREEQGKLEEVFEPNEESRVAARRKRIETQRKRALAKSSEREKLIREENRNPELREVPETAAKQRDKKEIEEEIPGTSRDFVNSQKGKHEKIEVRENENSKDEIKELKEVKTKKRGKNEVKEEKEKKGTRGEMEHKREKMEEEEHIEKERKEKMARKREFESFGELEEREEREGNSLSKRRFPKWMDAIAKQFPYYPNQVACALKEMQAAYRSMKRLKAENCDRYFRCRGSRAVVTKCGYYSIAVAVKVSLTRQWRTGGADTGYQSGPDSFGRKRGDCVQKYIYDTTSTAKPCYLPYQFF